MSPAPLLLKQIATGRRKPDMTRKEYFDHRFRVHGSITDGIEDKSLKPHKYIQTQVFDSVFGPRVGGPLNANQHWCGRDDASELFFRDWDHVLSTFRNPYVKEKVGPDAPLFADFETSIALMAYEKPVTLETRLQKEKLKQSLEQGNATVAMYFISTPDNSCEGQELERVLTPSLIDSLEKYAQDDVWGMLVNIGTVSSKVDLNSYFGGASMPQYALVYKVFLKDHASIRAFRKAQAAFTASNSHEIDVHTSFVLFGLEALVMDMGNNTRFNLNRQPLFPELEGPSHLDD